jgi:hypothetical protein
MYRDVHNIFESPGVVSVIKVIRVEWVRFVGKINDGKTVKKLQNVNLEKGAKKEDLD